MVEGRPWLVAFAIFYGVNILPMKFYSPNMKHGRARRCLLLLVCFEAGCIVSVNEMTVLGCWGGHRGRVHWWRLHNLYFSVYPQLPHLSETKQTSSMLRPVEEWRATTQEGMCLLKIFTEFFLLTPVGRLALGCRIFQKLGCLPETCKIAER